MTTTTQNAIKDFLNKRVPEEFLPIVAAFRKQIKMDFPNIKEEMRGGTEKYYGVPVYRNNNIVLTLSPTKTGITFAFTNGKMIRDKYSLLEGKGKKSLNLRVSSLDEYDSAKMKYYLDEAIKLDSK